jgi:hypothetical protein
LLRESPAPIEAADVRAWWLAFSAGPGAEGSPIDDAIAAGFAADRVGHAFVGGAQAGLRALVPSLSGAAIVAFCATEPGGNHPRAIETRLEPAGDGFVLSGSKRWSTMAPAADVLLVVAVEGMDPAARKRFRLVRVDPAAPGVTIAAMPAPRSMPEVPHGAVELDRVRVDRVAVLSGDGYADYVKPFRTVEDVHVHGALLGYLVGVARRHGFPTECLEALVASVVAIHACAQLPPDSPETHVALAGVLARDARVVAELAPWWAGVASDERTRWERDSPQLGAVAGQAKERRRERAWEILRGDTATP